MRTGGEQSGATAPSEKKVNHEEHHTGWNRAFAHLGWHVTSVFPTDLPAPCPHLPLSVTWTFKLSCHFHRGFRDLRNLETVREGRGLLGPQVLLF